MMIMPHMILRAAAGAACRYYPFAAEKRYRHHSVFVDCFHFVLGEFFRLFRRSFARRNFLPHMRRKKSRMGEPTDWHAFSLCNFSRGIPAIECLPIGRAL